jgi:hypothetical protein
VACDGGGVDRLLHDGHGDRPRRPEPRSGRRGDALQQRPRFVEEGRPAGGYDPKSDNARKNRSFGLFVGFTVAGGTALIAGVAGIVASQVRKPAAPASALEFVPVLSPQAGGALVRGRF